MTSAEHTMKTWDGLELFYRSWTPETPTDKALLLFHWVRAKWKVSLAAQSDRPESGNPLNFDE